ncbi:MAG TPA: 4Fe-4S binding protein [Gammaproteobacteria bacterium]|nr:4Fe-4S binding protein [Gammaproteobacteria bacterium]
MVDGSLQENTENRNNITSRFQISDSFADRLSCSTTDGAARKQALEVLARKTWNSTAVVPYRSSGRLLIIDQVHADVDQQRAIALAKDLVADGFNCTVLIGGLEPDSRDQVCRKLSTQNITVVAGRLADLAGFMGQFTALLEGKREDTDLAQLGPAAGDYFDLVLDLNIPPFLQREVLPPGYYAPAEDREYLRAALEEIPHMTGEFGKPVYVKYQANICTHGSKGITGCTRCLDVCPADAIGEKGEKIEVNTSLCQGCGSCIMNCPTGALSYTWPPVHEWLIMMRDILATYRNAGGSSPDLLLYDDKATGALQAHIDTLPDNLIPVPVEEIGSTGMDAWLSVLAYGAGSITLLVGDGTPRSILTGLRSQFSVAHAMLEGMGYAKERLCLVEAGGEKAFLTGNSGTRPRQENPAAGFNPFEKHRTIRLALDHLYKYAPAPRESASLPDGATFGEIQVDHDSCTLCMSCVAICPVQALQHDASQLQLGFVELNCVQCGLCRNACPEDSITLLPRYVYDDVLAGKPRVLNEDEPFCCITCGKPFISRRMYEAITEKLAATGNWKVKKDVVPEWLQMCGHCRTTYTRQG